MFRCAICFVRLCRGRLPRCDIVSKGRVFFSWRQTEGVICFFRYVCCGRLLPRTMWLCCTARHEFPSEVKAAPPCFDVLFVFFCVFTIRYKRSVAGWPVSALLLHTYIHTPEESKQIKRQPYTYIYMLCLRVLCFFPLSNERAHETCVSTRGP